MSHILLVTYQEWKSIYGHAAYFVSNFGSVMTCLIGPVTQLVNKYGYYVVRLRRRARYVHRLVATCFIENNDPESKRKFDHINRGRLGNNTSCSSGTM